jgi:hypothetical protein
MRGLLAPLSPHEEIALRKVGVGDPEPLARITFAACFSSILSNGTVGDGRSARRAAAGTRPW